MGKLLLIFIAILFSFSMIAQEHKEFGLHLGFGYRQLEFNETDIGNISINFGALYNLSKKTTLGVDVFLSPKGTYENTGKNGSKSTHVKYDANSFTFCPYFGYRVRNNYVVFAGVDLGVTTLYDIKKGYSNETAYKIDDEFYLGFNLGSIITVGEYFYLKPSVTFPKNINLSLGVGFYLP